MTWRESVESAEGKIKTRNLGVRVGQHEKYQPRMPQTPEKKKSCEAPTANRNKREKA